MRGPLEREVRQSLWLLLAIWAGLAVCVLAGAAAIPAVG